MAESITIGVIPPPKRLSETKIDPALERLTTYDFSCPICFEYMDEPVKTPCGHVFCQKCLQAEKKRKATFTCPLCQTDLKNFNPSKIDMATKKNFEDLNAKRAAAGLSKLDGSLRFITEVPSLKSIEAKKILERQQLQNGLRPLPRFRVTEVRSYHVTVIKIECFLEKRTTFWKEGKCEEKTSTKPWSIDISPSSYYNEEKKEVPVPGTQKDDKHISVRADFSVIRAESVVVGQAGIDVPTSQLKRVHSKGAKLEPTWHAIPPYNPKTETAKTVTDHRLNSGLEKLIDQQTSQAFKCQTRILARRYSFQTYRRCTVKSLWGNGAPFDYDILQSSRPLKSGDVTEFVPYQTVAWYKDYPVVSACCTLL